MTDDELEARLRDWYRAEIPADETAPIELRLLLPTIPHTSPRRIASRRGITLLAAATLVGLVGGAAAIGALRGPNPAPAAWTTTGRMIEDRALHTATLLADGRVLVAGGYGLHQDSAELFDPASRSWTATGRLTVDRAEQTATLLPGGRVLVAGGVSGAPASAELYDPATGTWTATGKMTEARHGHTATLLPDGTVLVAGGADHATAELYDPRSGTWTATGSMARRRHYHTATLLPDGMVLVAGDYAGDAFSNSAELYDPRTRTWTPTGSMIHGRWDFTATLLPDGTVLVAGTEGDSTRSSELYDPRTGIWTATGAMVEARHWPTATLLPDGTVLVAGGENGMNGIHEVASAELYDPRSRTWALTATMEVARRNHSATLLPDGRVLVAGGVVRNGGDATAEVYDPGTRRPSPTPAATASPIASPSAVRDASPSPQLSTPSSGLEPCVTARVFAGNALPAVDGKGLQGMGQIRGVYVAGRTPRLWAVHPGQSSATLIASLSPVPVFMDVLDISPDGSNALIELGSGGNSSTECDGLYLVRADGSGATRLTTTGRSPTGAFSPDGRRIAYSRSGAPGTITTLDLETGATVDQLCGSDYSSFEIHWSPSGERIAVDCDFSLTILNAAGTTAPVRFMTGGDPLAFSWTDDRHLVVATEGGDLYSFDVGSQTSSLLGRFADAEIEIVSTSGRFSPDGRWLAYHGGERGDVPGNDFREVGYLVPTSGGTPTRIPGEVNESTTWSGDSRALVSISSQDSDLILVRMDVENFQSSTIGTILDQASYLDVYQQGIWRVP